MNHISSYQYGKTILPHHGSKYFITQQMQNTLTWNYCLRENEKIDLENANGCLKKCFCYAWTHLAMGDAHKNTHDSYTE